MLYCNTAAEQLIDPYHNNGQLRTRACSTRHQPIGNVPYAAFLMQRYNFLGRHNQKSDEKMNNTPHAPYYETECNKQMSKAKLS